jgi:hypothetical protein
MNISKTSTYIETGTYMGKGVAQVLNQYKQIHTIELAEKWFKHNKEKWSQYTHVHVHHGDSKKLLPTLLKSIDEPVTIFLDAHYSGGTTAFGEEETPLLEELDLLKSRKHDDVILIDDCRLLGQFGQAGNGGKVYPFFESDWRGITLDTIKSIMKEGYRLDWNGTEKHDPNKILKDYQYDVLILHKPKK